MIQAPGRARITANGTIGITNKPVRVFGYSQKSGTGGPGLVQLLNGSDGTGTELWYKLGNTDDGVFQSFVPFGKHFPNGCFVQIDSNVQYVEIDYIQENA